MTQTARARLEFVADTSKYLAKIAEIERTQGKLAARAFVKRQEVEQRHLQTMERAQVQAARKHVSIQQKAAVSAGDAWRAAFAGVGLFAIAASLRALGGEVVAFVKSAAEMEVEIGRIATKTGLAVETIDALRLAAEASDLTVKDVTSGMGEFAKRIEDVGRGSGEALVAFRSLGIEVRDGNGALRSRNDIFREAITKIQGLSSETERAAAASRLFGEAGATMVGALKTRALDDWYEAAKRIGLVTSTNADEMGRWAAAGSRLSIAMDAVASDIWRSIGVRATGAVDALTFSIITAQETAKGLFSDMEKWAKNFAPAAAAFLAAPNTLAGMASASIYIARGMGRVVRETAEADEVSKAILEKWTALKKITESLGGEGAVDGPPSAAGGSRLSDAISAVDVKTPADALEDERSAAQRLADTYSYAINKGAEARLAAAKAAEEAAEAMAEERAAATAAAAEQARAARSTAEAYLGLGSTVVGVFREFAGESKALAVFDVLMKQAQAAASAAVGGALTGGPIGAAVAISTTLATFTGLIATLRSTNYHGGGRVGRDGMARVLRDEVVIPQPMARRMGGEQGIRDRLEGERRGPPVFVLDLGGEFVRVTAREVRRASGLQTADGMPLGWY